jgi:hypothetical protein
MGKQTIFDGLLAIALLFPSVARGQNATADPTSLRTRDAHQGLTIVADPYITAERYRKEVFGKNTPFAFGMVAIDVYFKNDNELPIRVNPETIQLVISVPDVERQRLGALSPDEVADRSVLTANANARLPSRFPFPSSSPRAKHSKEWMELSTTLHSIALGTDVLPPHSTTHGFLFFDLNHDFGAIHYSHLYIPDLAFMTNNKALFFFEIDLADAPTK